LREAALVNEQLLDANFNPCRYSPSELSRRRPIPRISPRVNYQLSSKITLDARYVYSRSETNNSGIGGFNCRARLDVSRDAAAVFLTETQW